MSLRDHVVSQFGNPHGLLGRLVGHILATRPSNRQRNAWTVELLKLEPHHRVLEFGCGPGVGLALSAARAAFVLGFDRSALMVEKSRKRLAAEIAAGRADVRCAATPDPNDGAGPFDRIFSINVIQFLPDMTETFRAFHRCLKTGGQVATTYQPRVKNPTRGHALAMADKIEAAMAAAGFTQLSRHELPLDPAPAICVMGVKL